MKIFISILILGLLLLGIPPIGLGSYAVYQVYAGSSEHLERAKILDILSKETTLYYSDGITQLGSLFGSEHRKYVTLKEIPPSMLNALVAAEDDGFYTHPGIDPVATLRAIFRNLFMGKREGASTITQQTVKNLYGRPETTLKSKFDEAINSLKMERMYDKKEILEFYLNQFHVTGNGRGIGIASKYYFDKETEELSLIECAFIAGSVKAPEKYNPFTKKSLDAQRKARAEAKGRKNYVLRRMLEKKYISSQEYEIAKSQEVPFRQGKFQFNDLFITELVERQLSRPEILKALGVERVDQLGNMGFRVTTTLNKNVQIASQYGVRQNLSRLEMILNGFSKESASRFVNIQNPEKFQFYVAKISKMNIPSKVDKTGKPSLELFLGVPFCQVESASLERVAKILDQTYRKGIEKSLASFLSQLKVGDYVLASIKSIDPNGSILCDLETKPKVQGALVVLDKGQVLAMVGGYSPYEYNRAVFAKRQPGSTFKSLTYLAALQLGWSPMDTLLNVRNVYTWQGQYYYPRPDHVPESLETTMAGAGAKSENLASVWLMAHLLDKLTFDQFRDLLNFLEVIDAGKSEMENLKFLGKKFNVTLDETEMKAGLFNLVKNDLLQDVVYSNDRRLKTVLKSMNFGIGAANEMARVIQNKKRFPEKEKLIRVNLLRNSFSKWQNSASQFVSLKKRLEQAINENAFPEELKKDMYALRKNSNNSGGPGTLSFVSSDFFQVKLLSDLIPEPELSIVSPSDLIEFLGQNKNALDDENILLDGIIPLSLIREFETQIESRFQAVSGSSYLEKLYWNSDFRYSLGMYYTQAMVKEMGVSTPLEWVPSFPLGTNSISLSDLALTYQSILDGQAHHYFEGSQSNQLLLVSRIEDNFGNLIWEAQRSSSKVFDPFYSSSMMSILRGTVTNGTAFAAHHNVVLDSNDAAIKSSLVNHEIRIPTFGKTGTTNDYTNATYVGFLPYPDVEGTTELSTRNAFTIASYVGYDNNFSMLKRGFKVAGGTGALPAWIESARALIKEYEFAKKIDWSAFQAKASGEIGFTYGEGTASFAAPVHSSILAFADDSITEESGSADLNSQINDYSTKKGAPLHLNLPGTVSNGLFEPTLKIQFFQKNATSEVNKPKVEATANSETAPSEVQATPIGGASEKNHLDEDLILEEDL